MPREMATSDAPTCAPWCGGCGAGLPLAPGHGGPPPADDEAMLVQTAKALAPSSAAWCRRARLRRLSRRLASVATQRPWRAIRTARGAACSCSSAVRAATCHAGPTFSNGEFADIGAPSSCARAWSTPAGTAASSAAGQPPFNLLGALPTRRPARPPRKTRHVQLQHRNFGEFKVPGLRNAWATAPYLHDGRLPRWPTWCATTTRSTSTACTPTASASSSRWANFMDGLRAVRALCSFGGLVRCEDALDELLPWAGNV
jgi:hypothetical protein